MIHRFAIPEGPGVRVDSGIEDGSVVSVYYDPMLAKVIAHGPTRREAAAMLASIMRRAVIHGPTTNRDLLVRVLEHEEFIGGDIDTHFLDRIGIEELARPLADEKTEHLAAVASALSDQVFDRTRAKVLTTIPSGWRSRPGRLQERGYRGEHGPHVIRYSVTEDTVVEGLADLEVTVSTADLVELRIDGASHRFSIARYGQVRHLESESGPVRLEEIPRFPSTESAGSPGSLHAPMPGKVIRVDVATGDQVNAGQVLLVLEAMKMEHTVKSPHDGTVLEVDCVPGDQVEAGTVLVVVEPPQEASTQG